MLKKQQKYCKNSDAKIQHYIEKMHKKVTIWTININKLIKILLFNIKH